MIAVHSEIAVPSSSSSAGTVPSGFLARKAGWRCSPAGTSTETYSIWSARPHSAAVSFTRAGLGKPGNSITRGTIALSKSDLSVGSWHLEPGQIRAKLYLQIDIIEDAVKETVSNILDAAEQRMRRGGYHAVSFRDLASDVGIKSASVHYYFPQKEHLGVGLVSRYAEAFMANLREQEASADTFELRRAAIRGAYRSVLRKTEAHCLCGMLGAEAGGLPDTVVAVVGGFFDAQVAWLEAAIPEQVKPKRRRTKAARVVAMLQGAMMMANAARDVQLFDTITATKGKTE